MKNQKDRFDLFAIQFSVDVNTVPDEMQIEAIELELFNMMEVKYDSAPIANFYKEYIQKSTYPHLHDNAKRAIYMHVRKHILLWAAFFENELLKR